MVNSEVNNKEGVDLAKVREAIEPLLSGHDVDLVDVEWISSRGGWVLRVTIEKAQAQGGDVGSPTLEQCTDVSRAVSAKLDELDLIAPHYNLEVSSPGLERKLRGRSDFERFSGKTAKVKLARPARDGQSLLRGLIEDVSNDEVVMNVDGKRMTAALSDIVDAQLVFELPGAPKKSGPKNSGKRAS